jgi:WD40 repeat protein
VHWDIESGEVINRVEGTHTAESDIGVSWEIAISPDGNSFFFVTDAADTEMFQFDIETLTEIKRFSTSWEDEGYLSIAITHDGRSALAGGFLGDIILFDLDTGEVIRRYNQGGVPTNINISADGERFVAAGTDGTVILWDFASGEAIQTFKGHTDVVTGAAFTSDESQIITSSGDGTLILWDVASGEALRTYSEHDAWVNRLALSPDGQLAYSTADDGTVIVRPITETPVDEILAHIANNRVLQEFTCAERKQYRIIPLCDANGLVPDSGN